MDENKSHVVQVGDGKKAVIPITYSFSGIDYSVKQKKKVDGKKQTITKQILHNVSGRIQPGEVCAIMGPSGAGKTTLLDLLANRVKFRPGTEGNDGTILLNGHRVDIKSFIKFSGYVTQNDVLTATMTVRETLRFYALLRLPKTTPREEKIQKAEQILEEMKLTRCADILVGNEKIRGISGGERRRVSIAVELLTEPSIIFLDEPTSGLDSSTAFQIMKTLRNLASSGRTVICTIHQPRANIFSMFDKLLLMAQGHTVYFGPAANAVNFFEESGYPCDKFNNPADFFMDLITLSKNLEEEADVGTKQSMAQADLDAIIERYRVSALNVDLQNDLAQELKTKDTKFEASVKLVGSSYPEQIRQLFKRELIEISRNPTGVRATVGQSLIQGLLIGFVFFRLGVGQSTVQSRTGVLATSMLSLVFPAVIGTVQIFPLKMVLFLKERASGVYNTSSYFIAKSMADLMAGVITPIIFGSLVYWMTNQLIYPFVDAGRFFIWIFQLILAQQLGYSLGLLIGAAAPNVDVAVILAPLLIIVQMLFSGFFLNFKDVPGWLVWVPYVSSLRYIFEGVFINIWRGVVFTCTQSQRLVDGTCQYKTGHALIEAFDFKDDTWIIWRDIIIIFFYGLAYRLLAYGIMRFKSRPKH